MDETFVLYGSPHSQFTYKVGLMLRLCGQRFAFRYISFRDGMHRSAAFLELNPFGQVPVLRHGDRILCQSGAILEYLSRELGRFAAADASQQQQVREWLFWDADRLGPAVYRSHGFELGRRGLLPRPSDPVLVAHYRELASAAFDMLDGRLAGRRFLVGVAPTVADIACYGDAAFAEQAGLETGERPNVSAWAERIVALPGHQPPLALLPMQDAAIG